MVTHPFSDNPAIVDAVRGLQQSVAETAPEKDAAAPAKTEVPDLEGLKKSLSAQSVEVMSREKYPELYSKLDSFYEGAKTLKGVTVIPAVPTLVLYDTSATMSPEGRWPGEFGFPNGVIAIPKTAIENLTSPELNAVLAHEVGHTILRKNATMYENYLPTNAKEFFDKMESQYVDKNNTSRQLIELVVDQMSLHLNCDPEALKSAFTKVDNYIDPKLIKKYIDAETKQVKGFGKLPHAEQERITRESILEYVRDPANNMQQHPDDPEVRLHAIPDSVAGCPAPAGRTR